MYRTFVPTVKVIADDSAVTRVLLTLAVCRSVVWNDPTAMRLASLRLPNHLSPGLPLFALLGLRFVKPTIFTETCEARAQA